MSYNAQQMATNLDAHGAASVFAFAFSFFSFSAAKGAGGAMV